LDAAAGTGILSRAIAQRGGQVTAIDLSSEMLMQGEKETKAAGIENITFMQGAVEKLPFSDHLFDKVICRFAFHHFENPAQVLSEMVRVCKSNGTVAVIDIISPEDENLAKSYNYYEILRDPSHTRALKRSDFLALFNKERVSVNEEDSIDVETNYEKWIQLTKPDKAIQEQITLDLIADIKEGKNTGLRPFYDNDNLYFLHTFFKIIGNTSE
jgi:ubiquinone/menaquinone biosynthesis C-methylase UbiE